MVVTSFTPYTEEEKKKNFEYLLTGCGRTPEERNPAYAKALRDAEERRRKRAEKTVDENFINHITESIMRKLKSKF
jgi:hypothetical protein